MINNKDDPSVFKEILNIVMRIGGKDDLWFMFYDAYKKYNVNLGLEELISLKKWSERPPNNWKRLNEEAGGTLK